MREIERPGMDARMRSGRGTPTWRRLLPVVVLAGAAVAFFALGLHNYLSFDQLREHRGELMAYVAGMPVNAALIYLALYAAATALAVPGGVVLTLAGGFLFGVWVGTGLTVLGATLGATGLFVIARSALGETLRAKAGPFIARMEAGFKEDALSYLLVLRLIPAFPFFIVNLVPALLGVPLRTFVIATFVGIVPGTFVFSSIGAGLGSIFDDMQELTLKAALTPQVVTALIGLAVLALIPVVVKRVKARKASLLQAGASPAADPIGAKSDPALASVGALSDDSGSQSARPGVAQTATAMQRTSSDRSKESTMQGPVINPAAAGSLRHELAGKCAIVTGSTSGIGLGIAQGLAKAGMNLVLNGFGDAREIEATRRRLAEDHGIGVIYSPADMSKAADIEAMVEAARAAFGTVDVLVNNAGIQHVEAIETFPPAKWDAIIAINLSSAFHATRAVVPGMKQRKWGRIVNIASAHGLVASPFKSAYVAAKHGVLGLTKTVALETAEHGITCNAICPGYVLTPLVQKQIPETAKARGLTEEQVIRDVLLHAQPTRQFVTTEQIAALTVFLCTGAGASITGAALPIEGGWTAQ